MDKAPVSTKVESDLMSQVARIEVLLEELYETVLRNTDGNLNQELRITDPITEQEATYFLMGLENRVFSIDELGYVQSALLPDSPKNIPNQRMIQLLWNQGQGVRTLFREGINQLATACRLIFEYGWQAHEIRMEPSHAEFGGFAYYVDMVVLGPDGTIPLCCENKRNNYEFRKLVKQFESCCARGKHDKEECGNRENHTKYEFCLHRQPKFFWLVSPGDEVFLKLSYGDMGRVRATELPEVLSKKAILSWPAS